MNQSVSDQINNGHRVSTRTVKECAPQMSGHDSQYPDLSLQSKSSRNVLLDEYCNGVSSTVCAKRTLEQRDAEDPRRPEEGGHEPRAGHHQAHAAAGAPRAVRERPRDGEVAVDADEQQVRDARVRHRVVHRQPAHAHQAAERPVAQRQIHGVQRHRHDADLRVHILVCSVH